MADDPFPFNPPEEWSEAQFYLWCNKIVIRPSVLDMYDKSKPTIIYGAPGSGVTTVLDMLRAYERENGNFVVDWKPQAEAFDGTVGSIVEHMAKEWMARSLATRKAKEPLPTFNNGILTLWFWLLTTYFYKGDILLTRWWFERHLEITYTVPYESFLTHQGTFTPFRVLAFLTDVVNALGYGVIICVSDHMNEAAIAFLQQWFRNSTLQEQFGLKTISGITAQQMTAFESNARIRRLRMEWGWDDLWQICTRLLEVALGYPVEISEKMKLLLQPLIEAELGKTPRGIKTLALTLYWLCQEYKTISIDFEIIKRDLYARSIRLYYDPHQQVILRGEKQLKRLKGVPLKIFEYLYVHRNSFVLKEDLCDDSLANTPENLDQIIKRIRRVIEPDFEEKKRNEWLYLQNEHGWGYKLLIH